MVMPVRPCADSGAPFTLKSAKPLSNSALLWEMTIAPSHLVLPLPHMRLKRYTRLHTREVKLI